MNKRSIIIGHGNPNKESWVEREWKRANLATGGVYTGDCPDCKAKGSIVFNRDLGHCICTYCSAPTLIIVNKTSAMGKSEQRLNSIWVAGTKGTPRG